MSENQKVTWHKPSGGLNVGLKVYNSISKQDEEFIPKDGKNVGWYICGPTVYDSAHLGHARNYVVFDILRRILTDYFGYDVFYVMNITDIDDKIIIRSHFRQLRKVYDEFIQFMNKKAEYTQTVQSNEEYTSLLKTVEEFLEKDCKLVDQLQDSHLKLCKIAKEIFSSEENVEEIFKEFSIQEGYLKLASIYEKEFLEDMETLGVRPPNALVRVSEYVDEIIEYIKKIIENGFAYEEDGDVFFDIQMFKSKGFDYGKTSPHDDNDVKALLDEGEGALSSHKMKKRNPQDFALWKKSKSGEPKWNSPWGEGRPGWHIECSAMCSDLLGSNVDINCGGIDLRFPHHDNQLAQSEAHFGCPQWVNYFLHSGHLHIDKLKMSKSLKNFISIRECLRLYHHRQIRFFFLMHRFSSNLEIEMVGGGLDKHTGKLVIQSASFLNTDVTEKVRSLVTSDKDKTRYALNIKKGTNLSELFGIDNDQNNNNNNNNISNTVITNENVNKNKMITIEYTMDGVKRFNGWEVSPGNDQHHTLLVEEINLIAGGRIAQFDDIINTEKIFVDFFSNMNVLLRMLPDLTSSSQKWTISDRKLFDRFQAAKTTIHNCLCDSFNTPGVIVELLALINETNAYANVFSSSLKRSILSEIAKYISKLMKIFGVIYDDDDQPERFGYAWSESKPSKTEGLVATILNRLSAFRDAVRAAARNKASAAEIISLCSSVSVPSSPSLVADQLLELLSSFVESVKNAADDPRLVLSICDAIRDDHVLRYGVRLEDDTFAKGSSSWKLDDIDSTVSSRSKKREEYLSHLRILAEKEEKKRLEEEKKKRQEIVARIPPSQYFSHPDGDYVGQFSAFDEKGFPTHDATGKEIAKSQKKKLETILKKHTTKYNSLASK